MSTLDELRRRLRFGRKSAAADGPAATLFEHVHTAQANQGSHDREPGPGVARPRAADRLPAAQVCRWPGSLPRPALRPTVIRDTPNHRRHRTAGAARHPPGLWRARTVITELEFKSLAAQGFNRIPLIAEAFADLETPLSLYLKLAYGRAAASTASCSNRSSAASASGAIRSSACRRARCCAPPASAPRSSPTAWSSRRTRAIRSTSSPPTSSASRSRCGPGLPRFCGGLAGYFGYDAVRYIEPKLAQTWKAGGIDTPDILLLQCEELAVIDNLSGRLYLIVYADPSQAEAFFRAKRRLSELADKLQVQRHGAGGQARRLAHGRARVRQGRLPRGGGEEQGVHRGRRHDAGADRPAAVEALHRIAA